MDNQILKKHWANTDWLLSHFWAKSSNRLKQMAGLPINPGDTVIDIGCGPGIYTAYIADLVGPTGKVLGIDCLPDSIEYASTLLSSRGCNHATAIVSSLEQTIDTMSEFDVVIFMNSLGYFSNPANTIKDVAERMRPGARIIVKDYDLESIFLSPMERQHLCKLIQGAWEGNTVDNPLAFNNFFGREVPFLANAYPFTSAHSTVWTQLMTFPFSLYEKQYICGNIQSIIDQARGKCAEDVINYFEKELGLEDADFFNNPKAMFAENEYVNVMTK